MELWIGALNLGFLYAFMAVGVLITFRVFDFPDITVDGSFTAGAATAALLVVSGVNPWTATAASFAVGLLAGGLTALIHTRFEIHGLLAGILVMTGLYSVNLHIMGRSNVPLLEEPSVLDAFGRMNPGIHPEVWTALCLAGVACLLWAALSLFFRTDLGLRMRATGNNPAMAAALGTNVRRMLVFGVALSNGLVGVSGALVAQYQGFADIGMGIGTILVGMASVIIGESLFRSRSVWVKVLSAVAGSVVFRMIIALALFAGMNPIDLKLLTAAFVLFVLVVSRRLAGPGRARRGLRARYASLGPRARVLSAVGGLCLLLLGGVLAVVAFRRPPETGAGVTKIGFVQLVDNGLLNVTRDAFLGEMGRLGYGRDGASEILVENANGDLPTVNTILDRFLMEDVDVVVPVSTGCTQAAVRKIKDRPVVFATVANPFIIGAGSSATEHLPNVTGVYGWVPMDETLALVRRILPGKITVGSLWDSSQANSVFNVEQLREAVKASEGATFEGVTVAGSSDVYQAALSLASRDVDAFVLPPDNIVYSAFDSVVRAAAPRRIPIVLSDVERLGDGALVAYGYDYTSSGEQAARLVDRILKGESPAGIPFERYEKMTLGINLEVAREAGIEIPPDVLARATLVIGGEEGARP